MDIRQTQLDAASWDAIISKHGGALQQSWRYGQAVDRGVHRFEFRDNGCLAGLAQAIVRRPAIGPTVALVSRGPVWLGKTCENWTLKSQLGSHLLISSSIGDRPGAGLALVSSASVAEIDLNTPQSALFANLHGIWRNRLRRAAHFGVSVHQSVDLDWILGKEAQNRAQKRYRGLDGNFIRRLCDRPRDWRLFVARHQGRAVAGALMLCHGTRATYCIGWAGQQGRLLNAQNAVLWSAMVTLKYQGICGLDLGVIDTVRAPGLARFKLGSGAQSIRLGQTHITGAIDFSTIGSTVRHFRPFARKTSMR